MCIGAVCQHNEFYSYGHWATVIGFGWTGYGPVITPQMSMSGRVELFTPVDRVMDFFHGLLLFQNDLVRTVFITMIVGIKSFSSFKVTQKWLLINT